MFVPLYVHMYGGLLLSFAVRCCFLYSLYVYTQLQCDVVPSPSGHLLLSIMSSGHQISDTEPQQNHNRFTTETSKQNYQIRDTEPQQNHQNKIIKSVIQNHNRIIKTKSWDQWQITTTKSLNQWQRTTTEPWNQWHRTTTEPSNNRIIKSLTQNHNKIIKSMTQNHNNINNMVLPILPFCFLSVFNKSFCKAS